MIKRYFSDTTLQRIKDDFKFLIKIIKDSNGELDFAIRDNYFNIYYKGNSIVKVELVINGNYRISIHRKFFDKTAADNDKFFNPSEKDEKDYRIIILTKNQLHLFFQKKHFLEFESRIKKVNYGEEINFEQMLITDNMNREDLIIIDRQITDTKLERERMDLLALKQIKENKYHFLVYEVKLGNNKDLEGKVITQLKTYTDHINKHFSDYKKCYELQYKQKKELRLFEYPTYESIEIVEPAKGKIIVGGYSGIASEKIKKLEKNNPSIEIKHCIHKL